MRLDHHTKENGNRSASPSPNGRGMLFTVLTSEHIVSIIEKDNESR